MRRASLARWLVIGALAAMGIVSAAASATAEEGNSSIQGQNSSEASAGASGNVSTSNDLTFSGGPSASATDEGPAQSSQAGDNSGTVNQGAEAKSADAAASSQVTGCVSGCKVQNQNESSGAVAVSGPATASNVGNVQMGPAADSIGGPTQASQAGDNRVRLDQWAYAASGDAIAGSQVTGGLAGGVVQNQNSSRGAFAFSGPAVAGNVGFVSGGPTASSLGPQAQASQFGGNNAVLSQGAEAQSGDAVAGSQVTGAIGKGAAVQNQNTTNFALGFSGPAIAANVALVNLGPGAFTAPGVNGTGSAQAGQTGTNEVLAVQRAGSHSGDAVAGSQVTGLVSAELGHMKVQNQQSSETDIAISGIAVAVNTAFVNAGPVAAAAPATGSATAQVAQLGGNKVVTSQVTDAQTGDALAGSQVTGGVGGLGANVQNSNVSRGTLAISGPAASINTVDVDAGPAALATQVETAGGTAGDVTAQSFQAGTNVVEVLQSGSSRSGDALAGSQVTGTTGTGLSGTVAGQNSARNQLALSGPAATVNTFTATAGPLARATTQANGAGSSAGQADAQASQTGGNVVHAAQVAGSISGDAVAGSQVTGVVSRDGSGAGVSNQNTSANAAALTGPAVAVNVAGAAAGPHALAVSTAFADETAVCPGGDCDAVAVAEAGDADAQSSQIGGNMAAVAQDALSVSGDAIAGSQVTGVVISGGAAHVQQQQSSSLVAALTGPAITVNAASAVAGPVADSTSAAFALAEAVCDDDCLAVAAAVAADSSSSVLQAGNNSIELVQTSDSLTGDALAGSQVAGLVVNGGHGIVQDQNTTTGALAVTGIALTLGAAQGVAGPWAVSSTQATATAVAECDQDCTALAVGLAPFDPTAQASQLGNNVSSVGQSLDSRTGDALAGSQVAGAVVTGGRAHLARQATTNGAVALSGSAFTSSLAGANAQPLAVAASNAEAAAVAPAGVTVALAVAGDAGAQTSQAGSNSAEALQVVGAATGDALAGSQVAAAVTETGNIRIQGQLSSNVALAVSGSSTAQADTLLLAGPEATADASASAIGLANLFAAVVAVGGTADAQASQIGGNDAGSIQVVLAGSGDALAGSQVAAGVAGRGSVTIADQLHSDVAIAIGGGAEAQASALVFAGAQATADASADAEAVFNAFTAAVAIGGSADSQASQAGRNEVRSVQAADAAAGDTIAGSQVSAGIAGSGSATIANQSSSDIAVAIGGTAVSEVGSVLFAGPSALADASASVFATLNLNVLVLGVGGDADAQASHAGRNIANTWQAADAATGDAVAGSQVTGVVVDAGKATVSNQAFTGLSLSISGSALAQNHLGATLGPEALGLSSTQLVAAFGAGAVVVGVAADSDAQSSQLGGNRLGLGQDASAVTGDALSGSQVTGVVLALGSQNVQLQNLSDVSLSLSGAVSSANVASGALGPLAVSFGAPASASHAGGSALEAMQQVHADSGDSVVGSQVTGG